MLALAIRLVASRMPISTPSRRGRATAEWRIAALAALGLLLAGAASAATEIYRVSLDATQEVPPNASAGKGTGNLSYDTVTKLLAYNISFSGLSSPENAAHIHGPALAGANAGVIFPLPLGSPIAGNVGPLTAAQEGYLRSGRLYVNIHTTINPGGEIRGQIDRQYDFPRTYLLIDIVGTVHNRVGLVGPTSVLVHNGFLRDTDGNGLEQVPIEMLSMNLTGFDPALGPVQLSMRPVTAHPFQISRGQAEETANTTPGNLDFPVNSFFDVFVQVDLPTLGAHYHNDVPVHLTGTFAGVPPVAGEVYLQSSPVPVVDQAENPTPYQIANTAHYPVPPIEHDSFPSSTAIIQIAGALNETVTLTGPTSVDVQLTPADTDGDGLEQVPTEMISMSLTGTSSVGPVAVSLRSPALDPFQRTLGEIEEDANTAPTRLDLPPFAPAGTAHSFFDVFFEINVAGARYHNRAPKHVAGTIKHKPPAPGDQYEDPTTIPLFDESGSPAPIYITDARHIPNPPPPPDSVERDTFPNSHAVMDINGPFGSDVVALNGPTRVDVHVMPDGSGALDTDGNGRDQVRTQMMEMNLSGTSSLYGPVLVKLNPLGPATMGQIEEQVNSVPGRLDVDPFTPGGIGDSFFDVFFEVDIPSGPPGMTQLHNIDPAHVAGTIRHKPPAPGDTYYKAGTVQLYDPSGAPVPLTIKVTRHTPDTQGGTIDVPIGKPPAALAITKIQPNPAGNSSRITLALPKAGRAKLLIYDVNGRSVRQLFDGSLAAGLRTVTWDTRNDRGQKVSAGVYFVRLESHGHLSVRRLVVSK